VAGHLAALATGARAGREEIRRLEAWAAEARQATAVIRGANAGRVIAVLAARPLVSAEDVATGAGISRMTAERMLNRMTNLGVIREITGASRFRLWRANPSAG
jgi:Fic family protein